MMCLWDAFKLDREPLISIPPTAVVSDPWSVDPRLATAAKQIEELGKDALAAGGKGRRVLPYSILSEITKAQLKAPPIDFKARKRGRRGGHQQSDASAQLPILRPPESGDAAKM